MAIGKSNLIEWRDDFFNKRNISKPTGEYLYSYKLRKGEFKSLEENFRYWIQEETQFRSVSHLVQYPLFNQLFVLYASEWWKRKYSGGHWSWDPILKDLGIDPNDWTAPKRSECVKKGFKEWWVGLNNKTGKRFLGSVAIQGGLPLNLMAENHGSVSRVLHRVVDLMPGTAIDPDLVMSWIRNLGYYLPHTYQKEEIYELLAETIMVISSIKQEAGSDNPSDIINEWVTNSEKWKNRFPISVGDDKTFRIIENLVKKVAESKRKVSANFITLERHLDFHGEDDQRLNIKIQFDEYVDEDALKKSFNIGDDELIDMQLILEIVCGEITREVSLRKLISSDKYKFSETIVGGFSGFEAKENLQINLRDKKGNRWCGSDFNLEKLESSLPWIFRFEDEDHLIFIGQGSCRISSNKFVAISHKNFSFQPDGDFDTLSTIFEDYEIIKFSSDAVFENQEGEEFIIKTKYVGDTESIEIRGEQLESIFEMPSKAFRGEPALFKKKESGVVKRFTNVIWKMGNRKFISSSNSIVGPVYALEEDDKYIRWRKRLAVIPENSSEEMIRGLNAKSGFWKLKNWQIAELEPLTQNVECVKREDEKWYFEFNGEGSTPEMIQTNVYWEGNTSPARIKLPFPTQGVRVFDKNSEEVKNGSLFSVAKTKGVRINLIPGDSKVVKLEIKTDSSSVPLKYIRFNENEITKQLRLTDYKSEFERLLSLSQDLDEAVYFNIYFGDTKVFGLKIKRYSFQLYSEEDRWYLPSEVLDKIFNGPDENHLTLKTQRLDVPGVADIEVPFRESGHLVIPDEVQSSGPWIIYSSKDSDLLMRPTHLNRNGNGVLPTSEDDLETAIRVDDKHERLHAIDKVFSKMVNKRDHKGWDTLARLANEYGHLPLNSLDVWSRAIYNPDLIAILISGRLDLPEGFIDRFALELPFMFEFIPISSFEKAILWQKESLEEYFSGEDLYDVVKRKKNISDWLFEFIKFSYQIALNKVVGLFDKEIIAGNTDLINLLLFNSPDSQYQRLRNPHESNEEWWPEFEPLKILLNKFIDEEEKIFFLNEGFRMVVLNIPILLAKWVHESSENLGKFSPEYVQMIRRIKDFDESWFNNAFNLSLLKLYYNE